MNCGASLILEEAWEAWLAEQMSGDSPAVRRAVESGISFEAAGARESPVFSLACELIEQRDAVADGRVETPWTDAQFAAAAEALREPIAELAEARRQDCRRPETDGCAGQIAELEAWVAQTPKAEFDALRAWLADAPAIKANSGQQGNWSSPAVLKTVKAGVGRVKEAIARLSGEADHRILCDLVEWLRPFLDRYRQAKERRRALDFTDLLLKARDMLRDSRAARDSFKRAFRFILVDEFQDTDPLQAEIVFFLSERAGEHAGDWEAVNLVPGKLFIVGDPKQSIYRFRRADLDLYGKVRQAIERQGATPQLSVNFRTVPWITGEVNRIFEPLMRGPAGDRFEPEHVALVPQRPDEGTEPRVLVPLPPKRLAGQTLKAEEWREKESGCIAAFIAELVRSGRFIRAGKPAAPSTMLRAALSNVERAVRRPVEHRDIAVLYRSATGLDALEEALRANDVPYQVSGGRYYYARMEFQDLLSTLKAIDNPFDGLSVVGALRSPFFGQSDEDLLRHFGAGGTFNYLARAPEGCGDLAESFDALRDLHERRRRHPASAVLARLFESTRALLIYANKPHGEQRVANLLKLQEIARAMAEAEVSPRSARSSDGSARWKARGRPSRKAPSPRPTRISSRL